MELNDNHADHFIPPPPVEHGLQPASDRIFTGPVFLRHALVDHDDQWCIGYVPVRERPPGDERDPHGLEVAGTHEAKIGLRQLAGRHTGHGFGAVRKIEVDGDGIHGERTGRAGR
jgi:hypothetical protein